MKVIRTLQISLTVMLLSAVVVPTVFANQSFQDTTDTYFDIYYLPTHPTEATQLGIHRFDDQLEDYSKSEIARQIDALALYRGNFIDIKPTELNDTERADRELLINSINDQLLKLKTIRMWEKNPDIYSSGIATSAFAIMSRQFAPVNDRLRSLIAREKLMPAVLEEARHNLKNPPLIYTKIALEQLPATINFFKTDVPAAFEKADDVALKEAFSKSNAKVVQALIEYQAWVEKSLLPRSHGDFRLGKDTFRKKLMYEEMVDMPLNQLLDVGMKNLRDNQSEFKRIAKEVYPDKSIEQVLVALRENHPASNQLLSKFSDTFDRLIAFIKDNHIITIPSDTRPIMEETPPFMRATTFASMDTPGPFEPKAKEAFFNVTLPGADWTAEHINDYMGAFNFPTISSIAIHETYPGHYVQFLWVPRIHDRVRQLIGASSNVEGWAHYAEQMMLDEGYHGVTTRDTQLLRLGELIDALLRNARFIVCIKMHTEKMTLDQAVDFFVNEGYQSRTAGMIEAKRGTADATYLFYTLGKLQIQKLRKDVEAQRGKDFNLQQFHDDFMQQGYPPIKIVRKALLHNDSPTL
jgi:uncharacterized protein (DUF885 family)